MRLDDYQWSRNPRGMHNEGVYRFRLGRYQEMQAGWVKLVAADEEYLSHIPELLAVGITPIIRIYREQLGGQPADARAYESIRRYINAGARWFELWNEPNLGNEWPGHLSGSLDPNNTGVYIGPLMDSWMDWAWRVTEMGGYPAFIALTEASEMPQATIPWLTNMMAYLRDNHYDRFRHVLANGLWLATHPYIYNHFYQEVPGGGPLSARQPDRQNATEGYWHFEYPADPICQNDDPGRTVWGGTPRTPYGDPIGLTAVGQAFMDLLRRFFGGGIVPVVGTEGGIWPWPGPGEPARIDDNRYPGVTWHSHAEAIVAMFNWIASGAAPPWFFGVTLWKEDIYWENSAGSVPTVSRLHDTAPPFKDVPALDTGGSTWYGPGVSPPEVEVPEGPGPVHGGPDYHFMLLSETVDADWFFAAAEAYWIRYHPVLVSSTDLIPLLPFDKTLAITVIVPPDQVEQMNTNIRDRWPNAWYDLVVVESAAALADVFRQRVSVGRRFG